jgi:hypothetical protein
MNDSHQRDLLLEWYRRIVLSSQSHYNTAQRLERLNLVIGIPVVILSVIVGTFTFASLGSEMGIFPQVLLGLASMLAAMLASLQTFLGISQRSERHVTFGARYGSLRREIETLFTQIPLPEDKFASIIQNLKNQLDLFSEQAPPIPSSIWLKTEERYKGRLKIRFPDSVFQSTTNNRQDDGKETTTSGTT